MTTAAKKASPLTYEQVQMATEARALAHSGATQSLINLFSIARKFCGNVGHRHAAERRAIDFDVIACARTLLALVRIIQHVRIDDSSSFAEKLWKVYHQEGVAWLAQHLPQQPLRHRMSVEEFLHLAREEHMKEHGLRAGGGGGVDHFVLQDDRDDEDMRAVALPPARSRAPSWDAVPAHQLHVMHTPDSEDEGDSSSSSSYISEWDDGDDYRHHHHIVAPAAEHDDDGGGDTAASSDEEVGGHGTSARRWQQKQQQRRPRLGHAVAGAALANLLRDGSKLNALDRQLIQSRVALETSQRHHRAAEEALQWHGLHRAATSQKLWEGTQTQADYKLSESLDKQNLRDTREALQQSEASVRRTAEARDKAAGRMNASSVMALAGLAAVPLGRRRQPRQRQA
jgi:hypothetical protein